MDRRSLAIAYSFNNNNNKSNKLYCYLLLLYLFIVVVVKIALLLLILLLDRHNPAILLQLVTAQSYKLCNVVGLVIKPNRKSLRRGIHARLALFTNALFITTDECLYVYSVILHFIMQYFFRLETLNNFVA